MIFTVEFYETQDGRCPVRDFLDVLKATDPGDFATVVAGLAHTEFKMKTTNFDRYLQAQLQNPDFAERFRNAGEAWDVSLQIATLRQQAGLSQKELAARLKTTQQQVSRLESPAYAGHSLSMLRRVAAALNFRVRVVLEKLPTDDADSAGSARSKNRKVNRRQGTR